MCLFTVWVLHLGIAVSHLLFNFGEPVSRVAQVSLVNLNQRFVMLSIFVRRLCVRGTKLVLRYLPPIGSHENESHILMFSMSSYRVIS